MDSVRAGLAQLLARVARQPRHRLALAAAAICLLALTTTVLAFSLRPSTPPAATALQTVTVSDPPTATLAPTATHAPKPTATEHLAPAPPPATKVVSSAPVHVAAPPPIPTPPPATPTPTPCPTAAFVTPTPTATGTATPSATLSGGTSTSPSPTGEIAPGPVGLSVRSVRSACTPCGQDAGGNPSVATIQAALDSAAQTYGLPVRLVDAVAWQESQWHEDVTSCDGGIGLMQIQYYTYPWLNTLSQGNCDVAIAPTSYDPYTVQGNANLGAKMLAWLKCLYEYDAQGGGSASSPVNGSSGYLYAQNGLDYPDLTTQSGTTLGACAQIGSSTPGTTGPTATPLYGACSLCLSLYNDNTNGPAATTYQDLQDPLGVGARWSCPFDPTKGVSDYELLDLTLSAYNEGANTLYAYGVLNANSYVGPVEYWVTTQPWP